MSLPCSIHVATEFGRFQEFTFCDGCFHIIKSDKVIMYAVFFALAWFPRCMRHTENMKIIKESTLLHSLVIKFVHYLKPNVSGNSANNRLSNVLLPEPERKTNTFTFWIVFLILIFKILNLNSNSNSPDGPQIISGRGPLLAILEKANEMNIKLDNFLIQNIITQSNKNVISNKNRQ